MNDWFIDLYGSSNLMSYMEENGYVFFKQENNLLYLSRRKVFELDFDIVLQEGEMYKEIGYIQGTYNDSKKTLNLFRIGVRPEYRDKGYGTKLYKLLENEALNILPIKEVDGTVSQQPNLEKRERFLKKLGFKLEDGKFSKMIKN